MRGSLLIGAVAMICVAAAAVLTIRPGERAEAAARPAPPAEEPAAAALRDAYRTCFLIWASEAAVIALRDGLGRTDLTELASVEVGTVLLRYREEDEAARLSILGLREESLLNREALAGASFRDAEARLAAEARAIGRRLERAEQNESLLAARHREGRIDRLTLEQAGDQLAELRGAADQTGHAATLLHADHAMRLAELRLERAMLAAEREALETARDALLMRSDEAGVISYIAPALATGGLTGIRRGDHLASIARPRLFIARIPLHARDLPLFTDRQVTARLSPDGSELKGRIERVRALRNALPDGSTHEIEIRFDPAGRETEPQPASCVFSPAGDEAP